MTTATAYIKIAGAKNKATEPIAAIVADVQERATKVKRRTKEHSSATSSSSDSDNQEMPTLKDSAVSHVIVPATYADVPVVKEDDSKDTKVTSTAVKADLEIPAAPAAVAKPQAVLLFDDEKLVSGPVFVTSNNVKTSRIVVTFPKSAESIGPDDLRDLLARCDPKRSYFMVQLHKTSRKPICGLEVVPCPKTPSVSLTTTTREHKDARKFLIRFASMLLVLVQRMSKTGRAYDQLMAVDPDQSGVEPLKLRLLTFDDDAHHHAFITIGDPRVSYMLRLDDKETALA